MKKNPLIKFGIANEYQCVMIQFLRQTQDQNHRLNVISCPKYLFQRFKIVFDECAVDARNFKTMNTLITDKDKIRLTDIVLRSAGFTIPSHNLQHSPNVQVEGHIYYFLKSKQCCDN